MLPGDAVLEEPGQYCPCGMSQIMGQYCSAGQLMWIFYKIYPKCDVLSHILNWSHYRLLLRVEDSEARSFYEAEAINACWSAREDVREGSVVVADEVNGERKQIPAGSVACIMLEPGTRISIYRPWFKWYGKYYTCLHYKTK